MTSLVVKDSSLTVTLRARGSLCAAVDLTDGRTIIVPFVCSPRLWHGKSEERSHFEIFGHGTYIHWPELDEDLTVAGLLAGFPSGENPKSLKRWLKQRGQKKRKSK